MGPLPNKLIYTQSEPIFTPSSIKLHKFHVRVIFKKISGLNEGLLASSLCLLPYASDYSNTLAPSLLSLCLQAVLLSGLSRGVLHQLGTLRLLWESLLNDLQ